MLVKGKPRVLSDSMGKGMLLTITDDPAVSDRLVKPEDAVSVAMGRQ